jgi:hypothetical protein
VKERIVKKREYVNQRWGSEPVAEFEYKPLQCKQAYRGVLRKHLSVERGENVWFDDIRYFFYFTTFKGMSQAQVVPKANQRCDQEKVRGQFKSGVNALRMPVADLVGNGLTWPAWPGTARRGWGC